MVSAKAFLLALLGLMALLAVVDGGATVYTQPINLPRKRTLVLLGAESDKQEYKKFFNHLESFLEVEYKTSDVTLQKYGEFLYDNLIIFGSTKDLNIEILSYVDGGNNIMVVSKPLKAGEEPEAALPEYLREAAIECGVYYSDTNVMDNFNNDGANDRIKTDNAIESKPILPNGLKKPIVYHGLGLLLEKHNPLLIPILSAEKTALTAPIQEDDEQSAPQAMGTNVVLVAGLQTRNGSRMVFAGSTDLFADSAPSQNLGFVKDIAAWAVQQRGVLRYSELSHNKQEQDERKAYRIRDHLHFQVKIEEFVDTKWVPYRANDIQLEFTMIDPYVRQSMQFNNVTNDGTYVLDFQAPDVYGIFKFNVDYRRVGYAPLIFYQQATVRPLKLNEYERYIPAAFPYYVCTFSAMAGFIIFALMFMGLKE